MTPILNDLASFLGLSLTADRTRGVSQRSDTRSGIWLGTATGETMTQVVADSAAQPSVGFVGRDGDLYYSASAPDGQSAIYRVGRGTLAEPTVVVDRGFNGVLSADEKTMMFVRSIPKQTVLRASVDGSRLEVLFDEFPALSPALAPDGKTLYFTSTRGGAYTLWSMAIPGGTPRSLGHTGMDVRFAIARDGRTGVFLDATRAVTLCDLPDCTNSRPAGTDAWGRFTPDGRALAFIPRADPHNVWVQAFGTTARPLTRFDERYTISDFSFSHDGTRLVLTRMLTTSDVVLIKGLR
jgi:Tol biopolymer transport system component